MSNTKASRTVEEIADMFRKMPNDNSKWNDTIFAVTAEYCEFLHDPPWPEHDGLHRSADLRADRAESEAALAKKMGPIKIEKTVSVNGNVVTMDFVSHMTLPDGEQLDVPGSYHFTIENGEAVRLLMVVDPKQTEKVSSLTDREEWSLTQRLDEAPPK